MPPWFADPRIGHFANDRSLSEAEVETLVHWVDGGAPEGDPGTKPAPIPWDDGWNIKPDVVYEMPQPFVIPKQGILQYVYILLPMKFAEDTWVLDGELRPGNRSVIHHASVIVRPPGSNWMRAAKPGVPYFAGIEEQPTPANPSSFLLGYAPGFSPHQDFLPGQDAGRLIPAGSDLLLEIHYTPNGTETTDQTKFGFVLAKKRPAKQLLNLVIDGRGFAIPPYATNHEGSAGVILNEPMTVVFAQPHLHLRGIDMKIDIFYPDGRSETLLSVPRYTFMWQLSYVLAKPLQLPKGTRVMVTAHWDNSANNKLNPDPSKTVRWGQQSTDEMLVALLGGVVDTTTDRYRTLTKPAFKGN